MIHGNQWLAKLGNIVWNFRRLHMKFSKDKEKIALQGDGEQS